MIIPKSILIVEDDVLTQRYLKHVLAQFGVQNINCFDNATDTLAEMRTEGYDMLLMDINIKGAIDGIQLAEIILHTYPELPIVFMTGYGDRETFNEVLSLNPYGFIVKPFSIRDIELHLQLAYNRYLIQKSIMEKKENFDNLDMLVINKEYKYSKTPMMLYHNNIPVKLNKQQLLLVDTLCEMYNRTVPFEVLIDRIWGPDISIETAIGTLRTLIYSLRKKLPNFPIYSYSKIGYALQISQERMN